MIEMFEELKKPYLNRINLCKDKSDECEFCQNEKTKLRIFDEAEKEVQKKN